MFLFVATRNCDLTLLAEEIDYVLRDCKPAVVIGHRKYEAKLRPLITHAQTYVDIDDLLAEESGFHETEPMVDLHRAAHILYTSGTTGKPKGVVTSHAALKAQITDLVEYWAWEPSDRILNVLPLHHLHGVVNKLACSLWTGAVCEFMDFDPKAVWGRFLAREKADLTVFMVCHLLCVTKYTHASQ